MKIGICKLCKEEKELLTCSHIIPKLLINNIFGSDQKAYSIQTPKNQYEPWVKKKSGVLYESDILCKTCDNECIGSLETYAQKVLLSEEYMEKDGLRTLKRESHVEICNVDINQIKLFIISILWRSCITSHPFFEAVKLGMYEEKLRGLLMEKPEIGFSDFPISILSWHHLESKIPLDFVGPPLVSKFKQKTIYTFRICGFVFSIIVGHDLEMMPDYFPSKDQFEIKSLPIYLLPLSLASKLSFLEYFILPKRELDQIVKENSRFIHKGLHKYK